jgi:hypothetical protein
MVYFIGEEMEVDKFFLSYFKLWHEIIITILGVYLEWLLHNFANLVIDGDEEIFSETVEFIERFLFTDYVGVEGKSHV